MKRKIWIEKVSTWGTVIAFVVTIIFLRVTVWSWGEFSAIKGATEQHIICDDTTSLMDIQKR